MIRFLFLSLLIFSPAVARGQIINGDFRQGAHGWNTTGNPLAFWFAFPDSGQDGYAVINNHFMHEGDTACIEQTVTCPSDDLAACRLVADCRLAEGTNEWVLETRVSLRIDG